MEVLEKENKIVSPKKANAKSRKKMKKKVIKKCKGLKELLEQIKDIKIEVKQKKVKKNNSKKEEIKLNQKEKLKNELTENLTDFITKDRKNETSEVASKDEIPVDSLVIKDNNNLKTLEKHDVSLSEKKNYYKRPNFLIKNTEINSENQKGQDPENNESSKRKISTATIDYFKGVDEYLKGVHKESIDLSSSMNFKKKEDIYYSINNNSRNNVPDLIPQNNFDNNYSCPKEINEKENNEIFIINEGDKAICSNECYGNNITVNENLYYDNTNDSDNININNNISNSILNNVNHSLNNISLYNEIINTEKEHKEESPIRFESNSPDSSCNNINTMSCINPFFDSNDSITQNDLILFTKNTIIFGQNYLNENKFKECNKVGLLTEIIEREDEINNNSSNNKFVTIQNDYRKCSYPFKYKFPENKNKYDSVLNNNTKKIANSCKKKKKSTFFKREGDWVCRKCYNLNFAFRLFCNRCAEPK